MGREGVEPCIVVIAAATAAVAASVTAARSHDAELLGEREREKRERGGIRVFEIGEGKGWVWNLVRKVRRTDRQDSQIINDER